MLLPGPAEAQIHRIGGTNSAISLRACYAMSGTDLAYAATSLGGPGRRRCQDCFRHLHSTFPLFIRFHLTPCIDFLIDLICAAALQVQLTCGSTLARDTWPDARARRASPAECGGCPGAVAARAGAVHDVPAGHVCSECRDCVL
eukprot:3205139-Rhodomonas_salina.1